MISIVYKSIKSEKKIQFFSVKPTESPHTPSRKRIRDNEPFVNPDHKRTKRSPDKPVHSEPLFDDPPNSAVEVDLDMDFDSFANIPSRSRTARSQQQAKKSPKSSPTKGDFQEVPIRGRHGRNIPNDKTETKKSNQPSTPVEITDSDEETHKVPKKETISESQKKRGRVSDSDDEFSVVPQRKRGRRTVRTVEPARIEPEADVHAEIGDANSDEDMFSTNNNKETDNFVPTRGEGDSRANAVRRPPTPPPETKAVNIKRSPGPSHGRQAKVGRRPHYILITTEKSVLYDQEKILLQYYDDSNNQ